MPEGIPALYIQDGKGGDAIVYAKLFGGPATWYVTEYNPETREIFGYVTGLWEDELGYASLKEMESIKWPIIEVDAYWEPKTLREVKEAIERGRPL